MRRRLRAVHPDRMHLVLMLALTFGTGVIDAVGYLGLDRVFTGNMTGNVVILGMALVGGDGLPVLGPLLALGGFMAGAALGGRVLRGAAHAWTGRTTGLLGLVGALVLVLAAVLAGPDPSRPVLLTVTALLGAAMGTQAATARFIAVKDVTTVVVTSTITGLAADSVLGGGQGGGTARRAAAVLVIVAGAAAGAALLHWHLWAGLVVEGVLVLLVVLAGALHAREHTLSPAGTRASRSR